ncbi:unnamed protein product [Pseudo-nitzschia multistriata]|uniref:Uncharacterized protein n=1 Tax=Pseudo-nitzschia multistriata TaxID=183589 RepID=A0A448YUZ0_9STRA|nr:unnamed protein product [Pseudo-nitzschia multistriata]
MSTSTSTFLQHIEHEGENKEKYDHLYHTQQQQEEQQQHLHEFRDEDDMITLDTQSTMTKTHNPYSPPIIGNMGSGSVPTVDERSHFLTRIEDMLERVEETILDASPSPRRYVRKDGDTSRPSDEYYEMEGKEDQQERRRSNTSTSSKNYMTTQSHHYTMKAVYEDDELASTDDEKESVTNNSDDSTNVVATQIAENRPLTSVGQRSEKKKHHNERPTHILVETGTSSPTHTNITMDATMMNDTYDVSLMERQERRSGETKAIIQEPSKTLDFDDELDNLSTVTPVLDRYRLDPSDGNSLSVKNLILHQESFELTWIET